MSILIDTGDISMKLEKYTENVNMVKEWLDESNDIGSEMEFVINTQLGMKVTDEKEAARHWTAIKSIIGLCPNPPIARRGANCPYRQHVENMEGLSDALSDLYAVAGSILFQHGKAGGGTFKKFEDYLNHTQETLIRGLKREAKEGRFSL
jgi:hypothetical protein|tara:strand:+ start:768 stop:1217 length:450 start_codon:yes stop_codon:yes gene_type:complete